MLTILQAETPDHIALARQLMTEYATALEFNLCFQNFEAEMAGLPGKYAPPAGRLLLAFWNGRPAGVIALRPLADNDGTCEMKRLYVRPEFRGKAIGRALVEKLIADARQSGYTSMRLDTIQGPMDQAISLYRELGFREIPPYYVSPVAGTLYMELSLTGQAGAGPAPELHEPAASTRKRT